MDTATGQVVSRAGHRFAEGAERRELYPVRDRLKKGVYWSDGVEFTADDVIYTLDTYFAGQGQAHLLGRRRDHQLRQVLQEDRRLHDRRSRPSKPAYDLATTLGVYTWGSGFNIVPKHVFEKQADLVAFKNEHPVTLGAYTLKSFDPNGQWHLWERRDDWQRSATGALGRARPPNTCFYKNFGDEQTRTLAFIKNQYDVDTFMSPDSIEAAQAAEPERSRRSPRRCRTTI